jgi:hypothetical protein
MGIPDAPLPAPRRESGLLSDPVAGMMAPPHLFA